MHAGRHHPFLSCVFILFEGGLYKGPCLTLICFNSYTQTLLSHLMAGQIETFINEIV